jgi:hypothetical protein
MKNKLPQIKAHVIIGGEFDTNIKGTRYMKVGSYKSTTKDKLNKLYRKLLGLSPCCVADTFNWDYDKKYCLKCGKKI